MSIDLLRTVRLLHRVLGFLAEQTPEHLSEIADGRRRLTSVGAGEPAAPPKPRPEAEALPGTRLGARVPRGPRSEPATRHKPPAEATDADYARLADELRSQESDSAGAAFLGAARLRGRKLLKPDLLKLGEQLGLSVAKSTTVPELTRKLVERAIGARKKYAGLSKW